MLNKNINIILVDGDSGSGKTTFVETFLDKNPDACALSLDCATSIAIFFAAVEIIE